MAFEYVRPTAWHEASRLVAQPGAVAKMGGCDVLTRHRRGKLRADLVVGLDLLPGAHHIHSPEDRITIGAGVTLAELERSAAFGERFPLLARVIGEIASPTIRNQASVIGNVAQGWDVSDLVPLFQACDATLGIVGTNGRRQMSVTDYARQRGQGALARGELIASLSLETPAPDFRIAYERFAFRDSFDLPLVAAAVSARVDRAVLRDVRIALVGASAMPARFEDAEEALDGEALDARTIAACIAAAGRAISPPEDQRASAAYRRQIVSVVLRRALEGLNQP